LAVRPFVLRPVAELAPELVLLGGLTVARVVEGLVDDGCVRLPGAEL
jgi:7,8-dihydro-6-hydroxymethylpterin-pyrophosphokinase